MTVVAEPGPTLPFTEAGRLLLCSDGLTDMVSDSRIEEILQYPFSRNPAQLLINEALAGGGKDNVTCLVMDISSPGMANKPTAGLIARIVNNIGNIAVKRGIRGNDK